MNQEFHDAAVEFEECGNEIRQLSERPWVGAPLTPEEEAYLRRLDDRMQKAGKRLRDATVRIFAKRV
jgi:hypothetical protein